MMFAPTSVQIKQKLPFLPSGKTDQDSPFLSQSLSELTKNLTSAFIQNIFKSNIAKENKRTSEQL